MEDDNTLTTPSGRNAIDLMEDLRFKGNPVTDLTTTEEHRLYFKKLNAGIDELQNWAKGLTVCLDESAEREELKEIAAVAMQGILAGASRFDSVSKVAQPKLFVPNKYDTAKKAIEMAETLIKELNKA